MIDNGKKLLRELMKLRRMSMTEQEYMMRNSQLMKMLYEFLPLQKAKVIHCFISSDELREVQTRKLISELIERGRAIQIPVIHEGALCSTTFTSWDELAPNRMGILEPKKIILADETPIDIILTPLLAADRNGNRLGYGKGYYDNFFSRLHHTPLKVGLAFDFQIASHVPHDDSDVTLGTIITETEIIEVYA
jgi:5-formyltetrahydrofolate cyclo-ligase